MADYQGGRLICIGFRRWKQMNLTPILRAGTKTPVFVPDACSASRLKPTEYDDFLWWSSTPPDGIIALATSSGAGTVRMEDGFVRSVGLGSDLIPPLSVILDRQGIYFDPRQPSDL